MAEYKTFIPASWAEFTAKCKALFPFLKKTFVGTREEWDILSTAEKIKYDVCDLVDDVAGGEMLISDEVAEGDMNPVTSNAVAKAVNYSTDEVKTGATWIDGKPIYRKCGYISGNVALMGAHYVIDSILGTSYVDNLINSGGSALGESNKLSIGGYVSTNATSEYRLGLAVMDNGLCLLSTNVPFTVRKVAWWVEYTKTTD